jgi:4-amino-4-deoxy-L-arabinose transferase-like glycosyltransferase
MTGGAMPRLIPPFLAPALLMGGLALALLGLALKGFFSAARYEGRRFSILLSLFVGAVIVVLMFGTTGPQRTELMRAEGAILLPYIGLGRYLSAVIPPRAGLIQAGTAIAILLLTPLLLIFKKKSAYPLVFWLFSVGFALAGGVYLSRRAVPPALVLLGLAGFYLFAFAFMRRLAEGPSLPSALSGKRGEILLALILLLGFLLRDYRLGEVSFRFDNYESDYALAGIRLLQGQHPIGYWTAMVWRGLGHNNLSPIYIYSVGLFYRLFGVSLVTLKLVSATYGLFALLLAYGIVRALFDKRLGLIAAFLFAVMPLHVNYSRIGLLLSSTLTVSLLIVYLLVRGILKRNFLAYALLGAVLPFAGYFYSPVKYPMLLSAVLIGAHILFQRGYFVRHFPGLLLLLLSLILVTAACHLPTQELINPGVADYESVWHRTQGHLYTQQADYRRAIPLIRENAALLVQSFFLDRNFNYDPWPRGNLYFHPVVSVLVLLGIAFCLATLHRPGSRLLLFFTFAFLVPNLFSRPSVMVRRTMLSWPFLCALAAIPFSELLALAPRIFGKKSAALIGGAVVLALLLIGAGDAAVFYLSDQPAGRWDEERAFDEEAKRLGEGRFLFITPHDQICRQTIDFILYDAATPREGRYRYLSGGEIAGLKAEEILKKAPAAFICSNNHVRRNTLEELRDRIGRGTVAEFQDKFGRLLAYTLTIDGEPGP